MKENSKLSKNFFLISFLPAAIYWYLEANYSLQTAIIGGVLLAFLEIILEWFFTKHIHIISKFNLGLMVFLGLLGFLGEEGIWFKLQPAFTGVGISLFLFYRLLLGRGTMIEMMESFNQENLPPYEVMRSLELHVAILFGSYGLFMIVVAIYLTTGQWLFFKTVGFYIVFAVFMVFEFFILRYKMKRMIAYQRKSDLLKKMDGRKF